MNALLITFCYGGEILNTSISVNYTIDAAYTISVSDNISFGDLRKHIHTGLGLLPSQYKLIIKVQINMAQSGLDFYYHSLFYVFIRRTYGEWSKCLLL
jgi:hypothetical protein